MKWPAYSDDIKKISLLPMGTCFSCEETVPGVLAIQTLCPTPHLYGLLSLLLEVSILLGGGNIYSPCATLWFYLCEHGEDISKRNGKSTLTLEVWVYELQVKQLKKAGLPGKWPLQFPAGSFPDREDGLISFLTLIMSLKVCIHKK